MIHEITKAAGKHRQRTRRGRGTGSGLGKTSGRGHKGAGSRAGSPLAEGGAKPFHRRLPKRGFNNANFKVSYELISLTDLNSFDDGSTVDAQAFCQAGIIKDTRGPIKVLGTGQLDKKLTVVAHKFSATAAQKITAAGGQAQTVA